MEPIRSTKTARLRRLKMYREDLDEFVAFFQNACTNVTISDGKNRYESLDEMKHYAGPTIRDFDIRGEKPGLHFLLNRTEHAPNSSTPAVFNELRTEEITDEADALFFRVREFLIDRQQPSVRKPMIAVAIACLGGVLWSALHNSYVNAQQERVVGSPLGLMISMIMLVVAILGSFGFVNRLSLETRAHSSSFWKRNREAFATHAITSAISGIVGYILGHFLK